MIATEPGKLKPGEVFPIHRSALRKRKKPAPGKPKRGAATPHTQGRFRVLNTFIDMTMRHLKPSETAVWFVLYRDTRDGVAKTAQTDIARRTGLSTRTVKRSIKRLKELGLVTIRSRGGLMKGPSHYQVHGTVVR